MPLSIFYASLGNTNWKYCWICGKPLIQGVTYPYTMDNEEERLTTINPGHNPAISESAKHCVCCSEECAELAFFTYL